MKKITSLLIIFSLIFTIATPAMAWEREQWLKFKRGVTNILTSPFEIPVEIKRYYKEGANNSKSTCLNVSIGTIKGIIDTVGRAGSGAWDVVTFNLPIPANYESLVSPEYVWDADKIE